MVVTNRIVITIGWILVLLSTALLFFTIQLNSNTLFFEDLARDILVYHGSWRAWQFTPTPAYIPDIALYFIAFKFLPLPIDRILFVILAEALLIAGCAVWLAKKIYPQLSAIAKAAILMVVALTSFIAAHSNMELYFDPVNSQVSSFLFSFLALGFILKYLVSNKNISLLKCLITIIVAIICDQLFIVGFYSTAIMILVFYLLCLGLKKKLTQYKKYEIPLLNTLITVIVAYPIARIITYFIKYDHEKLNPVPLSYFTLLHSWGQFKLAVISIFYPVNVFVWFYLLFISGALILCLILFIRLFSVEIKKIKTRRFDPILRIQFIGQADDPFTFCLFFLIFLIPVSFIGLMLSGNFQDIEQLRYFMLPIGLAVILAIIHLDTRRLVMLMKSVYILMVAVLAGIFVTIIQQLYPQGWQRIYSIRHQGVETFHHEAAVAECLQQVQKAKSLHSGVAGYWHSRGVALRLNNGIPIMAMHSNLMPKTLLNTDERYLNPKKYNINYDFVILEKNGKLFNANATSPFLPDGYEQHICENAPVEIWIYGNGILNTFLQAQIYKAFFVNNEINKLVWPAKLFTGSIGKMQGNLRVASAPLDHAGLLTKGLYLNLMPGYYKITLHYKAKNSLLNQAVGKLTIGRFNAPIYNKLLLEEALYSNNTIVSDYVLVKKKRYTIQEVRIWFSGHGSLAISSFEIERVTE